MVAKKTTIVDIAIAAGVSKTTVSRYINGKRDMISKSACERIEKAIQLSHYQPSAVARSLKTQRSYLIGVIVANITTPFATSLINGISQGLKKGGYVPIFADAEDSPETESKLLSSLTAHQVDGLIVNTTHTNNNELISLAMSGLPIVLVDRYVKDYNFDIAVSPYDRPTRELMEHLSEQGYRRAVLFTQEFANNSPRQIRHDAFVLSDRELFGAKDSDRDVFVVDPWAADTVEGAVNKLLSELDADNTKPCAIFCTNTVTLIAVYNALNKKGVKIPEEIGLCGPDDWGWAHSMGWDWPSNFAGGLTTIETNPELMGRLSAELMIERINNPDGEKRREFVPLTLKIRNTTVLK